MPPNAARMRRGKSSSASTPRVVLAFPVGDVGLPIVGREDRRNRPAVGDPRGCPANPLAGQQFHVRYRPVAERAPDEPPERWEPFFLQIGDGAAFPMGEYYDRKNFQRYCIENPEAPELIEHAPGLLECPLPGRDGKPGTSYLVAQPGAHPDLDGKGFIVECHAHAYFPPLPEGVRLCSTTYTLEEGLRVAYEVHDVTVPVRNLAAFDLQIRAFIASRRRPTLDARP